MESEQKLLEELAALEHEQWVEWAKSVAPEVKEERRARWQNYFVPYDQLEESAKDLDREWAEEVLDIIKPYMEKAKMAKEMVTKVEVDSERYPGIAEALKADVSDELDPFTRQYLETALWAETDQSNEQGGDPLDKNYSIENISPESLEKAKEDCKKFQEDNAQLLKDLDLSTAGHDFWLTRNGHGAGFWDGDYPGDLGDKLTEASKKFGEAYIYVGDDGLLYID